MHMGGMARGRLRKLIIFFAMHDQQWLSRDALMENAAKTVLDYEKKHGISADEPVSKKIRRRKSKR